MSDRKRRIPEDAKRCLHSNKDGSRCKVNKMTDFEYCYFHEPTMTEQRLENSKRGGKTPRLLPHQLPPPNMQTHEEVRQFTVETLHQVRTGELEPRTAAVVSSLVSHILKTLPDVSASSESTADKLRGLLLDVSEEEQDDEVSEPVSSDGPGKWQANTVSSI